MNSKFLKSLILFGIMASEVVVAMQSPHTKYDWLNDKKNYKERAISVLNGMDITIKDQDDTIKTQLEEIKRLKEENAELKNIPNNGASQLPLHSPFSPQYPQWQYQPPQYQPQEYPQWQYQPPQYQPTPSPYKGLEDDSQGQVEYSSVVPIMPHQNVLKNPIDEITLSKVLSICKATTLDELRAKEELNLGWKNLGAEESKNVIKVIKSLGSSQLKRFEFASNGLLDEGALEIADLFARNGIPYIEKLDLRLNGIGDAGIEALMRAVIENIDNLRYLKTIYLDKNKFGIDGINAIKGAREILRSKGINISY